MNDHEQSSTAGVRSAPWVLALALLVAAAAAPAQPATPAEPDEIGRGARIALLPLENLTGKAAPLRELRGALRLELERRGVDLLPDAELESFMARHRVRYSGGVSEQLSAAFRDETATTAAMVTSLELYEVGIPPKLVISCRLISTGEVTRILWNDSVALAGDQAPGALDMGVVDDFAIVQDRVLNQLADSLTRSLSGIDESRGSRIRVARRYRPKSFYQSTRSPTGEGGLPRVAVVPFINDSTRPHAGTLIMQHLVREFVRSDAVQVVEPGVVRQALLQGRVIRRDGLSLPQTELLRVMLDVDLVISGNTLDYQDFVGIGGNPVVTFSARAFDARRTEVSWAAVSYNRGRDGVFFFDVGRIHTAHALASKMARGVVYEALREPSGRVSTR